MEPVVDAGSVTAWVEAHLGVELDAWQRQVLERTLPRWIAAHEAQERYGIKAGTVRSWASRNRLHARGLDDAGRPLYDTREILRLAGYPPSSERCAA